MYKPPFPRKHFETLAEIVVLFQFSLLKAGFICHAGIDYGGFPSAKT